MKIKLLFTLLFSFILSACQNLSPPTTTPATEPLESWHINGSIAVTYTDKNCQRENCRGKSDQGKFDWWQKEDEFQIDLLDPFDRRLWRVAGQNQQAIFGNEKQSYVIESMDDFIESQFGLSLPFDTLKQWLQGRMDARFPYKQNDDAFEQLGFQIQMNFADFTSEENSANITHAKGYLPKRLTITDLTNKNKLKLVIRQWRQWKYAPE